MKESQHIEWKESWRDEYLKWICGFANADGGTLVIGRNDKGVVTGLKNAGKLLTDIPNKVRDILGIMVDVNLREEKGREYIEIIVESYPSPISYKGLHRLETFLFPEAALREALLNAVVHKDYSSGIPIQISVYEDRIYIWNSGDLPERWTLEKLLGKHPSIPFNPLIANTFFRAGYIESWGRGIEKIDRECREHEINPPVYDVDKTGLMLTFHANPLHIKAALGETASSAVSGKNGADTSDNRLVEKLGEKLGETRIVILQVMLENPQITIRKLAGILGISTTAIDKNIQYLKNEGYLKREGPAKGGHWKVMVGNDE